VFEFALDESAVHEDGLAAVIGMEGNNEVVAQLGFAGPGLDQDFLGVVEPAPEPYLSILKLWNDMWIDMLRQTDRIESHLILQVFDQVFLPAQALYLPGSKGEGEDGDGDEDKGHGCPSPIDAWLPVGSIQWLLECAGMGVSDSLAGPVRRRGEC